MNIRLATSEDLLKLQSCNVLCMPVSYHLKYCMYFLLSWPELIYIAEDHRNNVVGYVLARIEERDEEHEEDHGHITSIAVKQTYRRLGIAQKLLDQVSRAMIECYNVRYVSLNVSVKNHGALNLYKKALKFETHVLREGYYDDGTDAYGMRRNLVEFANEHHIQPAHPETFFKPRSSIKKELPASSK